MQMYQSSSIRGEEEPSELFQERNFACTQPATRGVFDVSAIKSWISDYPSETCPGEVEHYWSLFRPLSNDKGFITERAAKSVFCESKLSPQIVDRLWRNIGIYNMPMLNFTQFCIMMHELFGLIAVVCPYVLYPFEGFIFNPVSGFCQLALYVEFWMVFCEGLHPRFLNRLTIKSQAIFADLCRQSKMIVHHSERRHKANTSNFRR